MVKLRATAAAAALVGAAVALAPPAAADEQLNGDYSFVNGPTTNTWSILTQCNPERTCGGTVSSSTGMIAHISRLTGGPWTVERHDVANGRPCPAGGTGPADLLYSFDPATLAGTVTYKSKPGACNDPNPSEGALPVSLRLLGPTQPFPVFSSS